jgi:hypothetical protein
MVNVSVKIEVSSVLLLLTMRGAVLSGHLGKKLGLHVKSFERRARVSPLGTLKTR